jgi:putative transposase
MAFVFALDPTREQQRALLAHAGAARLTFNRHIARVKANLDQRAAEKTYGLADSELTPALSWSKFSFINEFNAWKNGAASNSPANADGSRGLAWRSEISADVFECASVDAAQALANFSTSRKGARRGRPVAFPRFKAKHKTTPAFRLRNRARLGATQAIRVAGPKSLLLPKLGQLRIHGCTRKLRRMLDAGRLHLYAASIRLARGRWWVTLTGLAAQFHPARRSPVGRHPKHAGLDRGVKSLAVVADTDGHVLHVVEGVKALQHGQQALRRANKALARTKPGSIGRRTAKARLTRIHARVAHLRAETAHHLSYWAATTLTRLTVEDLHVAGMTQLRTLARAVADAGMGDLGRMLAYKARWYGLKLIVADRWYASSKTCSGCRQVKARLGLGERVYRCGHCGLELDRDVNAAVNLARWSAWKTSPPLVAAA